MTQPHVLSRQQAVLTCAIAAVTAVACAAVCVAAILAPAPTGVAPLVACCCVCLPLLTSWPVPRAFAVLCPGRGRLDASAIAELRRRLDELPETEHPLGH